MYRIADKKVQLIKHPFLCFIKAIFPLINYDDEPSMSKGIVSQLPSSHLPYTECRSCSRTGSCPTVKIVTGYSSCFYVWLLLTYFLLLWYRFVQWMLYNYSTLLVFLWMLPILLNFLNIIKATDITYFCQYSEQYTLSTPIIDSMFSAYGISLHLLCKALSIAISCSSSLNLHHAGCFLFSSSCDKRLIDRCFKFTCFSCFNIHLKYLLCF